MNSCIKAVVLAVVGVYHSAWVCKFASKPQDFCNKSGYNSQNHIWRNPNTTCEQTQMSKHRSTVVELWWLWWFELVLLEQERGTFHSLTQPWNFPYKKVFQSQTWGCLTAKVWLKQGYVTGQASTSSSPLSCILYSCHSSLHHTLSRCHMNLLHVLLRHYIHGPPAW